MEYKKLVIRGISYSQTQPGAYALLLEHPDTSVKLPVVIGSPEAQSISIGLEKDLKPPRPLTHDLFARFITETGYRLDQVIIHQIVDGVFFSNLIFKLSDNELILDARTSDAVALAVRFDTPIYTTESVLSEAGMMLDISQEDSLSKESDFVDKTINDFAEELDSLESSLELVPIEDLESLLDTAVSEENYDKAAKIQQEILRRRKKID